MPRGPGVGERRAGSSSPAGPRPGECSFRQSLLHRPCTCCAPEAAGPGTPGGPGLVTHPNVEFLTAPGENVSCALSLRNDRGILGAQGGTPGVAKEEG